MRIQLSSQDPSFNSFLKCIYLINLVLVVCGLPLVVQSEGSSQLVAGFSRVCGLQQLWCRGLLVALRPVGFSLTWDGSHVPCIGRQILNHWTTREVAQCLCIKFPEVGLLDHRQFYFQFLKESACCFHSGYINFHPHPQCTRVPILHVLTNLLTLVFLMRAI